MSLTAGDREELRRLEESLWRAETRFDPGHMDAVLAEGAFEFGRSGRTYDRAAILAAERSDIDAELPLPQFTVHDVSPDAVLVTYVSRVRYETVEVANRSSLWVRRGGTWRLLFHQGTPIFHDP